MYKFIALILAFLLSCIASAGMNISPGTPAHNHADANTGGAALDCAGPCSARACATGFTRMSPHYCARNDATVTLQAWANATACTARTSTPALPAGAKMAYLTVYWQALSSNVIGVRTNTTAFHVDSICTAGARQTATRHTSREQVAVAAATVLGQHSDHLFIPLVTTNTFYTTQLNAGGNGNAEIQGFQLDGYTD